MSIFQGTLDKYVQDQLKKPAALNLDFSYLSKRPTLLQNVKRIEDEIYN